MQHHMSYFDDSKTLILTAVPHYQICIDELCVSVVQLKKISRHSPVIFNTSYIIGRLLAPLNQFHDSFVIHNHYFLRHFRNKDYLI